MEFDIGTILYILITIVAVLVGVFGKKKKPAEGAPGSTEGEARTSFMENLERVLTQGQEPAQVRDLQDFESDLPAEEYASEELVEESQTEDRGGESIMDRYEEIMRRNVDSDPDIMASDGRLTEEALEVIDLDVEHGTDYFEIVRDFDAGTAVVYSAIINRLDY
jgi:hypothetical protein